VFVELGKFLKEEKELETIEDFWLFYLAKSTEVKHPPVKAKDVNILKAYEILERFNWDEAAYDSYIRAKLLADTEKLELEDSFDKGKTEGKAEGKLEGKLEIAKNLIAKGFDENAILELTGFTKQEIKKYFN